MQQNKQQLSAMKRKVGDTGVEELRPGEPPAKINSRWTNDELLMAVTAVRKYGKIFFMKKNILICEFEYKCFIYKIFLVPPVSLACIVLRITNRFGRGRLVLRHSVPYTLLNFAAEFSAVFILYQSEEMEM